MYGAPILQKTGQPEGSAVLSFLFLANGSPNRVGVTAFTKRGTSASSLAKAFTPALVSGVLSTFTRQMRRASLLLQMLSESSHLLSLTS